VGKFWCREGDVGCRRGDVGRRGKSRAKAVFMCVRDLGRQSERSGREGTGQMMGRIMKCGAWLGLWCCGEVKLPGLDIPSIIQVISVVQRKY
jgi:hypothetical protein